MCTCRGCSRVGGGGGGVENGHLQGDLLIKHAWNSEIVNLLNKWINKIIHTYFPQQPFSLTANLY